MYIYNYIYDIYVYILYVYIYTRYMYIYIHIYIYIHVYYKKWGNLSSCHSQVDRAIRRLGHRHCQLCYRFFGSPLMTWTVVLFGMTQVTDLEFECQSPRYSKFHQKILDRFHLTNPCNYIHTFSSNPKASQEG